MLLIGALLSCSKQSGGAGAATKKNWNLGLQPNEAVKDVDTLNKKLQSKLNFQLNVQIANTYQEIVDSLKTSKIDFAVLSPLTLVQAEREVALKVLLKKVYGQSEFYYSAIMVNKKSKAKSLKDLNQKKIAFVDMKSASGYLYPRAMLKKAGVDFDKMTAIFAGTHFKALDLLIKGEVEAAAVWADEPSSNRGAWSEKEAPASASQSLKVLKYSDAIPNDAIVAREEVYQSHPEAVLEFMNAFIELSDDPQKILKEVFGVDKFTTATSRHYDSIRELEEFLKEGK
jgi:phosphonate transport system substrate-binding protein